MVSIGEIVRTRKPHPCGNDSWTVLRTGADVKLKCNKCGRTVMLDYADFLKAQKKENNNGGK